MFLKEIKDRVKSVEKWQDRQDDRMQQNEINLAKVNGYNVSNKISITYMIGRIQELEAQVKELKPAPQIKLSGRWKPELGDKYFISSIVGNIQEVTWHADRIDDFQYSIGSVSQTKEQGEIARDKQILLVEMEDFARSFLKRMTTGFFEISYDLDSKTLIPRLSIPEPMGLYFNTYDNCQAAISKFAPRLHLLFPSINTPLL